MTKKNLILIGICSALSATGVFAASTSFASSAVLSVTNNSGAPVTFNFDAATGSSSDCTPSTDPATGTKILACVAKPGNSTFTFDTGYRAYSFGQLPANTQCYTPPSPISAGLQVAGGATVPCTVGGTTPPVVQKPVINTKDLNTVINSGSQPYSINLKLANEITPASIFDESSNITFKPLNGETTLTYDPQTFTISQTGPAPTPGTSVQYELIAKNSAGTADQTITVTYTKSVTPITPEQKPVINKQDLTQVVKSGETYSKPLAGEITPSNFFSESDSQITFKPLNGETAVTYDPSTHTIKQTGAIPEGKTIQYELTASNNAGSDDETINVTFLKQVGPIPPAAPITISPSSLPLTHIKAPGDSYKQTFTVSNIDKPIHLAFLGGAYEPALPSATPPCQFDKASSSETCDVTATMPSDSAGKTYGYEIYLQYKGHVAKTNIVKVQVDKKPTPPPSSVTVAPNTGAIIYYYIEPTDAARLKTTYPLPTGANGAKLVPQNIYLDSYLGLYGSDASNYDPNGKTLAAIDGNSSSSWLQGKSDIYLGIDTDGSPDATKNIDKLKPIIDSVIKANPNISIKGLYIDDENMAKADRKPFFKALHQIEPNLTLAIYSSAIKNDVDPTDTDTAGSILWLTTLYDLASGIDHGDSNVSANIDVLGKSMRNQAAAAEVAGVNFQYTLPGQGSWGNAVAYNTAVDTKSGYSGKGQATTWDGTAPNTSANPYDSGKTGYVQTFNKASGSNGYPQQGMYDCPAYKVLQVLNTSQAIDADKWDSLRKQIANDCGFSYYEPNALAAIAPYEDVDGEGNPTPSGKALQAFVNSHFKGFGIYSIAANPDKENIIPQPYPKTLSPNDWTAFLKGDWNSKL